MLFYLIPTVVFAYCERGDTSCWPTAAEVQALSDALNPESPRALWWQGDTENPLPRVSGVPVFSPGDQPLYGLGANGYQLQPVYTQDSDPSQQCYTDANGQPDLANEGRLPCFAATRNNPQEEWMPGFIVFPLTAEHVQTAVNFAKEHDLCIMVAGSGHDFQNRHSCKDGIFIRTTLIKGMDFDENDSRGFGWADGNVQVGSGTVWSEVHYEAAQRGLVVSSGWASTVGVAGWSMGGGHGPIANHAGMGVDNLLEIEIVTADGDILTANANDNSDLFWALRGGGGSTFGIATKYTIRTHKLPEGGLTYYKLYTQGDFCKWRFWKNGKKARDSALEAYLDWTQGLDERWSGLNFAGPYQDEWYNCNAGWYLDLTYWYFGPKEDGNAEWDDLVKSFEDAGVRNVTSTVTSYSTMWENVKTDLEPIIPWTWVSVGVQSVLVPRENVESGMLLDRAIENMDAAKKKGLNGGGCRDPGYPIGGGSKCVYNRQEFYNDITGNLGAAERQTDPVSISASFRTAMFHLVSAGWTKEEFDEQFEPLGENSYLSESAYDMDDWPKRLWGDNYAKLLAVKLKYDPNNVFWCRHCVGDDSDPGTKLVNDILKDLGCNQED